MAKWAYGVTTVYSRMTDLLPRTLDSLHKAGFTTPRLFVDGVSFKVAQQYEQHYAPLGIEVEVRRQNIRAQGNWTLGLWELYIRNPQSDYYAMFQDDIVLCRNVKRYLEHCQYPRDGYWNLYTAWENLNVVRRDISTHKHIQGWHPSNQLGRGALALVFDNRAVVKLLGHAHIIKKIKSVDMGTCNVDGGIAEVFRLSEGKEYIHHPSLASHTGDHSTMKSARPRPCRSFAGEDFDAMQLLTAKPATTSK